MELYAAFSGTGSANASYCHHVLRKGGGKVQTEEFL